MKKKPSLYYWNIIVPQLQADALRAGLKQTFGVDSNWKTLFGTINLAVEIPKGREELIDKCDFYISGFLQAVANTRNRLEGVYSDAVKYPQLSIPEHQLKRLKSLIW